MVQHRAVDVIDVVKDYMRGPVLRGVSFSVDEGDITCIVGPSGTGKSTLLRCLNGLEDTTSGVVIINGSLVGLRMHRGKLQRMSERERCLLRQTVGMVFQNFALFRNLNVLENVALAPKLHRTASKQTIFRKSEVLLERVGMIDKRYAFPHELSGGQQQRVAIARALCMDPYLMLFDEPTSALDTDSKREVQEVIRDLATDGMTMIIVTHDTKLVSDIATHCVVLEEGIVVESGPIDYLKNSTDERSRRFMGL